MCDPASSVSSEEIFKSFNLQSAMEQRKRFLAAWINCGMRHVLKRLAEKVFSKYIMAQVLEMKKTSACFHD
jgi:hypothetical protein